jgi:hypothetical protein
MGVLHHPSLHTKIEGIPLDHPSYWISYSSSAPQGTLANPMALVSPLHQKSVRQERLIPWLCYPYNIRQCQTRKACHPYCISVRQGWLIPWMWDSHCNRESPIRKADPTVVVSSRHRYGWLIPMLWYPQGIRKGRLIPRLWYPLGIDMDGWSQCCGILKASDKER